MVAVMTETYDRRAYRRLPAELHPAEDALNAWGAMRRRDLAPNDLPGQSTLYRHMDKDWLEAARTDPDVEPAYMPKLVAFYQSQTPIVQRFMRLRWITQLTTEASGRRVNMSQYKSELLVRQIRQTVLRSVLAATL